MIFFFSLLIWKFWHCFTITKIQNEQKQNRSLKCVETRKPRQFRVAESCCLRECELAPHSTHFAIFSFLLSIILTYIASQLSSKIYLPQYRHSSAILHTYGFPRPYFSIVCPISHVLLRPTTFCTDDISLCLYLDQSNPYASHDLPSNFL